MDWSLSQIVIISFDICFVKFKLLIQKIHSFARSSYEMNTLADNLRSRCLQI
jgi:hypothetical protein